MAGFFDKLKGGGGKKRRTGGGRRSGGGGSRRPHSQRRDPGNETEFVNVPPAPPPPPPSAGPPASPAPSAPSPVAPPPAAPSPPVSAVPSAGDAGATAYHAVGPSKGGMVGILIARNGKLRDEIYKIHDGENILGRGAGAEICIDSREDSISREHCTIIHQSGNFGIKPLKDTNPTFLNDEPVTGGAALTDGDEIRAGDTTFKFRVV